MQKATGHTTTTKKATRRDEKTKTTRTRTTEREAEYNPTTQKDDRTKTTTREKRGPDGRLQGVKSRTTHTRKEDEKDAIGRISEKRDELL